MASSTYLVWVQNDGVLRSLLFDCVTSVTTTVSTEVTEHPVEQGANIVDHVRDVPETVEIEAFLTNHPLDDSASSLNFGFRGRVVPVELNIEPYEAPFAFTPGAAYAAVGKAVSSGLETLFGGGGPKRYAAQVFKFDGDKDLVAETFGLLRVARAKKALFQVVTREEIFKDMVLKECTLARDASTGSGARLSLSFVHIRRVQVSIVDAPDPTEVRATPAVKRGVKDTKDANAASRYKSMLKGFFGKKDGVTISR